MRALLLAFGLILYGWGVHAQNSQRVDTDFGFQDMKLGSAISTHPEMVYAGLGGDNDLELRYYERPGRTSAFAGIPLESVRYAYYKGRLGALLLQAGSEHKAALKRALLSRYGKPVQYSKSYEWAGQHATVVLDESDATQSLVLIASYEFKKMTEARMKKQPVK